MAAADPPTHLRSRRTLARPSWTLARLTDPAVRPPDADHIPATVPGAVQLDWARAHDLPELNFGQNVRAWGGLEDSFWLYRTTLPSAQLDAGDRLVLAGGGLDYHAEIRIGGDLRLTHTGCFTPFEIDVTADAADTPVEILLHPAPKRHAAPADRSQASHVTKPAVSYGWDWHPRLIPVGLCEDVRFEIRRAADPDHVDFDYTLTDDFSEARITVIVEPEAPFTWTLRDQGGKNVLTATDPNATLADPQIWWTHDHGTPARYTLEVTVGEHLTLKRRVGFRRVRLVMHDGAWDHPASFPKSRSHPPATLELNGRRIFARGANWVNPDIFHGRITAATTRPLIDLARDAHFNLLRCWGGAPVQRESFFDQCDELGVLVWQEFPLACNPYPDDPAYLALLDRESRAIIRRVRQHPCLAMWCGGNELFNAWSGMTDQSLALRLLNRNCYDLDPATPFLATSPLDGMGHGDYRFLDADGRDVFQIMQSAIGTAYTEFGCSGPSPVDYLETFIPPDELWPPRPGTSWETHHAFGAWDADPTTWLGLRTLEHLFGNSSSVAELVARGEWLQCEGFRSIYEESRRQSPRCAMALAWCFNEPWPSAANNSLVNFPARPKPAYFAVQQACRPILASARIPKFQWAAHELFTAEIWILDDHPETAPGAELVATLICDETKTELLRWTIPDLEAQTNIPGPSVRHRLPASHSGEFTLELTITDHPDWNSTYHLSLLPRVETTSDTTRALNL